MSVHTRIFIGLLVGCLAGVVMRSLYPPGPDGAASPIVANTVYAIAEPLGRIFLNLIFMVVVPLVFSALVLGVAGAGDIRHVGRLGLRTLLMTVVLSAASVAIGVTLANTLRPGASLDAQDRVQLSKRFETDAQKRVAAAKSAKSARDQLLEIIPRNPLAEMVGAADGSSPGGGMLAVMFFALALGMALLSIGESAARPVTAFFDGLFQACMKIVGLAMLFAPFGVAGLMFSVTAALGVDILRVLLLYAITVLVGLSLQMFGVYSLVLSLFARMNPLTFFRRISDVIFTSLATSSSNATLPTALRVAREDLKLKPQVSNFVLTVGATANQNGTALFEGVTVLFLAQAFGVELTFANQVTVVLMCILGGIGTAGVPSGSIPFIALVLGSIGVPPEAVGVVLGVDRVLDMCRTVVNVSGDITIATCVDRWEQDQPAHQGESP
ncbi:MAG: dicarboxylate/amino acid:cation symporter [Phycisphaerales bacterium]|nr:dicarboxylate/amino acid:cation symporter [Phycisphaerales bacterium]